MEFEPPAPRQEAIEPPGDPRKNIFPEHLLPVQCFLEFLDQLGHDFKRVADDSCDWNNQIDLQSETAENQSVDHISRKLSNYDSLFIVLLSGFLLHSER